jgi:predicted lipid-binding transport protein (Tim44 family)
VPIRPSRKAVFAAGARAAFEMIIHDFAAADAATLCHLLNDEVFANFKDAIEARRKAGHTLSTRSEKWGGASSAALPYWVELP